MRGVRGATADGVCLRLEGVGLWRAGKTILREISWEVQQWEHWAVLGPNGSGKTSVIMIATGYQPASAGRVYLLAGYIADIVLPEVRKRVALASAALSEAQVARQGDATGLEVTLSGRHASLGLHRRPTAAEVKQARGIMARLGIESLEHARFRKLSTGERQLCMLARCQMAEGLITFLDEPCAGLDLAARETLLAAVQRSCSAGGGPVVVATHHPDEIVPAISHVLLLRGGRVVAQGPRAEVLTSAGLSEAFGLPLRVIEESGRVFVVPRA